MAGLIIKSLSIFLICMEVILFIHIFTNFLPIQSVRNAVENITEPLLRPIRYLLKHSIFGTGGIDSSPIIAFIVLSYFGQLLSLL